MEVVFITTGYLQIRTSNQHNEPVANASVRVFKIEKQQIIFEQRCMTDALGLSESIALEAPDSEVSLNSDHTTLPYATYSVEVVKEGYDMEVRIGVQIFANVNSMMDVNMNAKTAGQTKRNVIIIDPHGLNNVAGDPNA